jgi:hypothetical protein
MMKTVVTKNVLSESGLECDVEVQNVYHDLELPLSERWPRDWRTSSQDREGEMEVFYSRAAAQKYRRYESLLLWSGIGIGIVGTLFVQWLAG